MTQPGEALREALHSWRTSAGFTLREAASRVAADFTYLSKIEHGHDRPSRKLVAELDAVYHADGALLAAYDAAPCPRCGRARVPQQAAWLALIDDLHAEFDQGHMKVAAIIDRHRPAIDAATVAGDTRNAYWFNRGQKAAAADEAERLKQALRVATHKQHDQLGEPVEGFPVCSDCGAIQTDVLRREAARSET